MCRLEDLELRFGVAVGCVVVVGRDSGLCEFGYWVFLQQGIIRACGFPFVCIFSRAGFCLNM